MDQYYGEQQSGRGSNNNGNSYNYYSSYRMNNAMSTIEPSCVTFTLWNRCLIVKICPPIPGEEGKFDTKNGFPVYLSHTKARILAYELRKFIEDPNSGGRGVSSGQSSISIHSYTKEDGVEVPILLIKKIEEDGTVDENNYGIYEFKTDYYFSIRDYEYNLTSGGLFSKEFKEFNILEIEQLITVLETYYEAMTGAVAYTIIEQIKWDVNRIIDAIGGKVSNNRNRRTNYSTGYFNSNNGVDSSVPEVNIFAIGNLEDIV